MNSKIIQIDTNTEIENLIYAIRGKQVMLDSDLAKLYQVETKRLNEQVKRNIERFPENFMFQLSESETENLRSQIATSSLNDNYGGRRYFPYVFTEQGIAMLSAVLRSNVAVEISIRIMNAFVNMRKVLSLNKEIFSRLDRVELKQLETDKKFEEIFNYIASKQEISQRIFFEGQIYDAFSLIINLIKKAKDSIILIDNYVNIETLNILSHRDNNKIKIEIFTLKKTKLKQIDIKKFNVQYKNLSVNYIENFHDRFLILDKKICYHIGASLKDLGKKSFAISEIENKDLIKNILNKIKIKEEI